MVNESQEILKEIDSSFLFSPFFHLVTRANQELNILFGETRIFDKIFFPLLLKSYLKQI